MTIRCQNSWNQVENGRKRKFQYSNTKIYERPLFCFGTGTSITSGVVKLVWLIRTSTLREVMRSCKCIQHVSKISIPTRITSRIRITALYHFRSWICGSSNGGLVKFLLYRDSSMGGVLPHQFIYRCSTLVVL